MADRAQVEDYKITPEMKNFAKTYRKFNEISTRLRNKLQIQLDDASKTRQMLGQMEQGMQLLLQKAPQQPTFEVPGQGEGETTEQPDEMGQMRQDMQSMNPQINY